MSIPITLQQLLMISVNFVDSLILSNISQSQMTAVSLAAQMFFVFSILCSGVTTSGLVLVSQFYGKRDLKSVRKITAMMMRISVIIGLVTSIIATFFPSGFMRLYSHDQFIIQYGVSYLRIIGLTYLLFSASNTVFYALKAIGNTRFYLICSIVTYSVNLLFDFLFAKGIGPIPPMGIMGVAVGTLTARILEFTMAAFYFFRVEKSIKFSISDLIIFDKKLLIRFLGVAKGIMAHQVIWSLGMTMTPSIMGRSSTTAAASYNVAYLFFNLLNSNLLGLSGGGVILIGQTLGRGEMEKAKSEAYQLIKIGTVFGIANALIMIIFRRGFISLYNLDEMSKSLASGMILVIAGVAFFSVYEYMGLVGVLRAGGDGVTGFITDVISIWLVAVPIALLMINKGVLNPIIILALLKLDMPIKSMVGLIKALRFKWIVNLT